MVQMIKMRSYLAVDNHCCAAPNADTLYTEAWLDVSKEPVVFRIPDMGSRYYLMPMMSGWSEVIYVAGSATTGGNAQTYLITGPGWKGQVSPGMKQVASPTGMVWILGRIYSSGTPEDYAAVHALQDAFQVVPLSQKDAAGDAYDGAKNQYVMRFAKGQLPPAEAFWSITLYDSEFFFVPNAINRYEIASRDKLVANADGSIDLYLQAESPGKDKEANWLPAPKDKFQLVMRLYQPRNTAPSILDGSWTPPPVTRLGR